MKYLVLVCTLVTANIALADCKLEFTGTLEKQIRWSAPKHDTDGNVLKAGSLKSFKIYAVETNQQGDIAKTVKLLAVATPDETSCMLKLDESMQQIAMKAVDGDGVSDYSNVIRSL